MCEPVTMTALSVGQAASGYMAAGARAKAQAQAQAVATQQERERAGRENTAIRARQSQQRDAIASEIEEGARRANQARATATVASAEAGITGRAADLIAQDVNVQHARHNQALIKQRAENDFSSNLQVEEARMRNRSNLQRINKPIEQPSLLGSVMEGVAGIANVQTQTANYTKAMGEAPSFGGMFGMLGIHPYAPRAQVVTESSMPAMARVVNENAIYANSPMARVVNENAIYANKIVPINSKPNSLPDWSGSSAASGSLLPPI